MQLTIPGNQEPQRLTQPSSYRADIDGLRAIAVLSVVIYHAFPSTLRGGFIGVDIFFVISGFLISSIIFDGLVHNKFSFLEFYARRVRRIFPALILVLITCLAFGWFLLLANEYQALGKHVAGGAAFVSNFTLWSESGYFDVAAQSKPLLHLWSLGIEEQFYLFWPLLLWLAYRNHKNFLALTLLIALASFAINIWTVSSNPVAAFYSPLSRFWELMIGGILAYLVLHKPQYVSKYSGVQSLTGLLLIATSLFILRDDSTFPGWWALLPTVGTFLVLSAMPTAWLNRHVLSNRILVWVGLISYPLYLWHWPVLYLMSLVSVRSHISRLIAVSLSVVLAALTYLMIEKPIRRSKAMGRNVGFLIAGMTACGIFGLSSLVSGGLGFRLPQQFNAFTRSSPADSPKDCLLKDRADFAPKCTEVLRRPAIFIWGDSHANSLAAGFTSLQDKGEISKLEVTGSSCPPLLDFKSNGNSKCEEINSYALERIKLLRPDIVILHAIWEYDAYDLSKLPSTVKRLKEAGASNIVLLGPVPRWNGSLLRSVFRCWRPRSASEKFPQYSKCGLDSHIPEVDASLRDTARLLDVKYISAYQALCTSDGCLTHVRGTNGTDQLVTYDYGHLSEGAAAYLVTAISEDLFSTERLDAPRPPSSSIAVCLLMCSRTGILEPLTNSPN